MMLVCIKQHQATFQAQFMKKLCNTEAELKKSDAFKKSVCFFFTQVLFLTILSIYEIKKPTNVLIRKRNGEFVKQ